MATFSASFRVMGNNLDPDEISRRLKLTPDRSHKRGDPSFGKSGRRYSDFSEGLWALKSSLGETASLEDHLKYIVDKLADHTVAVRELQSLGYRLDVFVGVFGEQTGTLGFALPSDLLKTLGGIGLTLEFDVYD